MRLNCPFVRSFFISAFCLLSGCSSNQQLTGTQIIANTKPVSKSRTIASTVSGGRSQMVNWKGHRVHYEEFGHNAEDAIVFIHGWTCDSTFWDAQIMELAARQRVIRIDLPGHGKSDKPTTLQYSVDEFVDAIDAVFQFAGVRRAVLIGHSLGGLTVRHFYRKFPKQVTALVLADSFLGPASKDLEKDFAQKVKDLQGANYKKVAAAMVDTMFVAQSPESVRTDIKQKMLAAKKHVAWKALRGMASEALYKPDAIKVPVLHFRVKSPDLDINNEKFLRTFIADLSYQEWDDTGHFLMMEKPEKFNLEVQRFLLKRGI